MPRTCTICAHPAREAVDRALVEAEESYRCIAAQFSVSASALRRHKAHIPLALVQAREAEEAADANDLLAQVQDLKAKALRILDQAESAGELDTAIRAIREARGCVELLAKLAGELSEAPAVNVLIMPEWVALRGAILQALVEHPEARLAVVEAIGGCLSGR